MSPDELREIIPVGELKFSASRSGGPGGQNINKVNTKVELRFNILKSPSLSDTEKDHILKKLVTRINNEGVLIITARSERTQLMNKKKAEDKFYKLIAKALTIYPERKSTTPTKSSKIKRVEGKKLHGQIKKLRKKTDLGQE
ncbi:MAG TPA: alternative ribosome rescue aminoacyl-tRNA hydrolase ArfB [Bacteroidales bacterium]|nr:alternative ribosome rescue aminoacyl-tRNA hydrolase ArfB [Bacteroidales bacterium]HPI68901.1 alternative ribosome rescue aminoacyl-tRNA hydrolase ArfB [Bacteroidales bacterium]HPR72297.1 alternative ribosome rescue aminoacyl-tRNA hydrolase ArfB [Bacteroidales bacterium]